MAARSVSGPRAAAVEPSAKQQALIEAATRLFSLYGLRRTTMEQIARDAGVAKATAYAHFGNKDEVFVAVCESVAARMLASAETAAAAASSPDGRVVALLLGKFLLAHALVHASPHARELLEVSERLGADVLAAARERFVGMLAAELVRGHDLGKSEAKRIANTLEIATEALSARAATEREFRKQATELAELVLAGLAARKQN